MTATVADLRAAVKAKVLTVADMGAVFDHEPYVKEASALKDLYINSAQGGTRLYGWYIRRVRTFEQLVSTGRNYEDHYWRLKGFMSFNEDDVTEKKFDDQIELMRDAFRADSQLGGICVTQFNEMNGSQAGLQLEESEPVMFCGVLCHSARLSLITRVFTNT